MHFISLHLLLPLLIGGVAVAAEPKIIERRVAIENVCAWPNLTLLQDGTMIATIFNQPSHAMMEGDVDCYASRDGREWVKRGAAAVHDPGTNRMNVSAGLGRGGELLVLSSGWSLKMVGEKVGGLDKVLRPWICLSKDGGSSWSVDKESFPASPEGSAEYIPFGDILPGADGALRTTCYSRDEATKRDGVFLLRSPDAKSWLVQSRISDANNETAILHLGDGQWLAAARSLKETGQRLDLFRSSDDGATWMAAGAVTEASQHPGHLMRLDGGRVLLTYGNRIAGSHGVQAKLSADGGVTWGPPMALVDDLRSGDCGYPATVQIANGELVTAYYSNGAPGYPGYHMGVVIWRTEE